MVKLKLQWKSEINLSISLSIKNMNKKKWSLLCYDFIIELNDHHLLRFVYGLSSSLPAAYRKQQHKNNPMNIPAITPAIAPPIAPPTAALLDPYSKNSCENVESSSLALLLIFSIFLWKEEKLKNKENGSAGFILN